MEDITAERDQIINLLGITPADLKIGPDPMFGVDLADINKIFGDHKKASLQQVITDLKDASVSSKIGNLKSIDIKLIAKLTDLKAAYKDDPGLNSSLENLFKQLYELQLRILIMRCYKIEKEVIQEVPTGPTKELIKDLSDLLTDKLKNLNEIYDQKTAKYKEGMKESAIAGGGYNSNIFRSKYNKYKNKYLNLRYNQYNQ